MSRQANPSAAAQAKRDWQAGRCDRCGFPVHTHFTVGVPSGCPRAPDAPSCQHTGCKAKATDLVLSLCAEHELPPIDRTKNQATRIRHRLARELTL